MLLGVDQLTLSVRGLPESEPGERCQGRKVWMAVRGKSMDGCLGERYGWLSGGKVWMAVRVEKYGRLSGWKSMDGCLGGKVWTAVRVEKYGRLSGWKGMDGCLGGKVPGLPSASEVRLT